MSPGQNVCALPIVVVGWMVEPCPIMGRHLVQGGLVSQWKMIHLCRGLLHSFFERHTDRGAIFVRPEASQRLPCGQVRPEIVPSELKRFRRIDLAVVVVGSCHEGNANFHCRVTFRSNLKSRALAYADPYTPMLPLHHG